MTIQSATALNNAGEMTVTQFIQYGKLVDALWAGGIGEVEFTEVALELGATLDRINGALNDVRDEDGVL